MADAFEKAKENTKGLNEKLGFILDAVTSIGDKLVASFEEKDVLTSEKERTQQQTIKVKQHTDTNNKCKTKY